MGGGGGVGGGGGGGVTRWFTARSASRDNTTQRVNYDWLKTPCQPHRSDTDSSRCRVARITGYSSGLSGGRGWRV